MTHRPQRRAANGARPVIRPPALFPSPAPLPVPPHSFRHARAPSRPPALFPSCPRPFPSPPASSVMPAPPSVIPAKAGIHPSVSSITRRVPQHPGRVFKRPPPAHPVMPRFLRRPAGGHSTRRASPAFRNAVTTYSNCSAVCSELTVRRSRLPWTGTVGGRMAGT